MTAAVWGFVQGMLILRRPALWVIGLTLVGFLLGVFSDFLLTWHTFLAIDSGSDVYPLKSWTALTCLIQLILTLLFAMLGTKRSPAL